MQRQKPEDFIEIADECLEMIRENSAADTIRIITEFLADAYNGGYDCGQEEQANVVRHSS